jgi:hypothetical protein
MDEGNDAATQKKSQATVFWTFGQEPMQRRKKKSQATVLLNMDEGNTVKKTGKFEILS